ncbi:glycosyltransferase family 2 protein [Paenibacillus nasutitermitis]|uniref:Glycosyl transferase n=1 Tax=Paenibacillus nasutitermitis TaxID=1652958 RepID=A0A916Z4A6_9BACL|nr:glycosyltransferase family 2 protein [Paenibacillus nasutitermitis]GGD75538.1 glycosyl transferase [Paenibacillus nasutitermitis]
MTKISVLMPVYNSIRYIDEAVNSILRQTYKDFEFLIIDDCSSDGTLEYLQNLKDRRIRLITHAQNKGLVYSLNEGLDLAKGEYIARMDGDDISAPLRFERQLLYMKQNPEVGVLGTFMTFLHNGLHHPKPESHEEICCWQLFYCCFVHPTVFMRSSVLKQNDIRYDPDFLHAEDYEIWNQLAAVTRLANLPEYLLSYRIHPNQVSTSYLQIQNETADRVRIKQLNKLGIVPTEEEFTIHKQFLQYGIPVYDFNLYSKALAWAEKLLEHNLRKGIYHQATLNSLLSLCFTRSENNFR